MFAISRRPTAPLPLCVSAFSLSITLLSIAPAQAQAPVSAAVGAANKAELVNRVHEFQGNDIWPSKLIGTFNWKLSAPAWKLMLSPEGVNGVAYLSKDVGNYIKAQGGGDIAEVEESNHNDRQSMQGEVDQLIAQSKTKFSFTMEATQPKISPVQGKLMLDYLAVVAGFLDSRHWTPRGGRANLKLVFSSTAKDVAVTTSKDATNFTIIAPLKEPADWGGKIERGLKRGGK